MLGCVCNVLEYVVIVVVVGCLHVILCVCVVIAIVVIIVMTLSGKWDKCIFRSCHTTIWHKAKRNKFKHTHSHRKRDTRKNA